MNYPWVKEYLLAKPGVEMNHRTEWNWDCYMVGRKMFAAVCYDDARTTFITARLLPAEGQLLRSRYPDILPGFYMNKRHWNSVCANGTIPDELLKIMLDKSYDIVFRKLRKKKQAEILRLTQTDKR